MIGTGNPDFIVGELAIGGIILVFLWRMFVWLRESPRTPDPWDDVTEKRLNEPEAVEVCSRCFKPLTSDRWFCEHCGHAVGPYNNLMPFIYVFSEGEVLRAGVSDKLRPRPLIVVGYVLLSVSVYLFFAPIYWFFLFKNLTRRKDDSLSETVSTVPRP